MSGFPLVARKFLFPSDFTSQRPAKNWDIALPEFPATFAQMSTVILPDPHNTDYVHPLSIEAYQALGEMGHLGKNTELLYGVVFTKMPKSPLHASISTRLFKLVRKAASEEMYVVRSEQPITCTKSGSEPEPDVSVVHGGEAEFWTSHPTTAELVIEIAVTSEDYDRSKDGGNAGNPSFPGEMAEFDRLLQASDRKADDLSKPLTHTYELLPAKAD